MLSEARLSWCARSRPSGSASPGLAEATSCVNRSLTLAGEDGPCPRGNGREATRAPRSARVSRGDRRTVTTKSCRRTKRRNEWSLIVAAVMAIKLVERLAGATIRNKTVEERWGHALRQHPHRRLEHGRPVTRPRPRCSSRRTPTCASPSAPPDRRRLQEVLRRRDRHLRRLAPDRGRTRKSAARRAGVECVELQVANDGTRGRRQPRERLGGLPDGRAAEDDLEPRQHDRQLEPGRSELPGRAARALRPRHRLGDVRLLHRRHQR